MRKKDILKPQISEFSALGLREQIESGNAGRDSSRAGLLIDHADSVYENGRYDQQSFDNIGNLADDVDSGVAKNKTAIPDQATGAIERPFIRRQYSNINKAAALLERDNNPPFRKFDNTVPEPVSDGLAGFNVVVPELQTPQFLDIPIDSDGPVESRNIPSSPNTGSGEAQYTTLVRASLSSPITTEQFRITSFFGPRVRPKRGASTYHYGLDIAIANGASILAVADGTVKKVGYQKEGYGVYVVIQHSGFETRYAHGKRAVVRNNKTVARGEKIMLGNSSGTSTGNHLHFEVRVNGKPVDPLPFLDIQGRR